MTMKPVRQRAACQRGFTLIEIMVVIAIMGLIMAMGMPSIIQAFKKEGMRKAVDEVQNLCAKARSEAICNNRTTWVYFYPQMTDRRYQLDGDPVIGGAALMDQLSARNSDATTSTNSVLPSHDAGNTDSAGVLPDDVQIEMFDINQQDFAESPYGRVRFFPDGTCDEMVLVLRYKADTRKISLEYATAMTEVEEIHK